MEFSQFNHNYEGKLYQFAYVVNNIYQGGSEVWKLDLGDASGKTLKKFSPGDTMSFAEPVFIQSPDKSGEDEGVSSAAR